MVSYVVSTRKLGKEKAARFGLTIILKKGENQAFQFLKTRVSFKAMHNNHINWLKAIIT